MSALNLRVNGRIIDDFHKDGKRYVEGRKGSSYEIEFQNLSSKRKKIIVSVDGLNVVSGDNNWEHGYVVEPGQHLIIPGWRKDAGNVAKFIFSSLKGSYNQHNDAGNELNIGVIGCKAFDEVPAQKVVYNHYYPYYPSIYVLPQWQYYYPPYYPYYGGAGYTLTGGSNTPLQQGHSVNCSYTSGDYSGLSAADQAKLSTPLPNLCAEDSKGVYYAAAGSQNAVGTGWGENKQFQTHDVNYQFAKSFSELFMVYYDDRRGLERRGIDLYQDRRQHRQPEPQAFPSGIGCPLPK